MFAKFNYVDGKVYLGTILLQVSPVGSFIAKYLFEDFNFLKWLVIVMILDLLTGLVKVAKKDGYKAITSKGLRDTVNKCIQYGSFLIVTHVLTHYEIGGEQHKGLLWLDSVAHEFILLIEIKSVYENIILINPKLDFAEVVIRKMMTFLPKKYIPNDTTTGNTVSKS